MQRFVLKSSFQPAGDQPHAIAQLTEGLRRCLNHQVLLGVTGSGKTFTIANVIRNTQKPTLVISHNKTLAAQLYQELKTFFPENAVHYFVSYYDYYQPEAYIPQSDTYIEKDVKINEELDRMRHAATQAILTRNDVIVVASVSCIYNIGSPEEYGELALTLVRGSRLTHRELTGNLVALQYARNDIELLPGTFRVRGEFMEIAPATGTEVLVVEMAGGTLRGLRRRSGLGIADPEVAVEKAMVFPAKFWVAPAAKLKLAFANIEAELAERLKELRGAGKLLEAQRLAQRTRNDLAMMREAGYCHGIENYSRHLEFRKPGTPPFTLLDYFEAAYGGIKTGSFGPAAVGPQANFSPRAKNWLTVIDESHMTLPQLRGMWLGDKARKETLIEFGFRLPSAIDNRPLTFQEAMGKFKQTVYMSATPGEYELEKASGARKAREQEERVERESEWSERASGVVEQVVRPTGLLDPIIEVRGTKNQIPALMEEIRKCTARGERSLVLALTKRLAEDLAEHFAERGFKVNYLHAEIKTLERPHRIRELRAGDVDMLIGINLLREGIDIPEVSLVAVLDADKEGFLRNETSLVQMMGRAARHKDGRVLLFADTVTGSMRSAIAETERRRKKQEEFNRTHGIVPATISKPILAPFASAASGAGNRRGDEKTVAPKKAAAALIAQLEREMKAHAKNLDFENAARVRDLLRKLTGT